MPAPTYRYIILSGDRVVDVLLPEEGRHRISLAKETDSDEPINKQDAVRKEGGLNTLEWLLSDLDVSIEDVKAPVSVHAHDIHWGLRLVPKHLYSQEPSDPKVYRVVDRHLHAASISDAQLFPTICNKKGVISASLTVIADYVSHIANNDGWRMYTEELAKPDDRQAIRRIIMLPRQMPYAVSRGRWPESSSDLWEAFRTDTGFPHVAQRDTLIITSLDRLRQDGAKISKRISWDKTFQGFVTEIDSFPLLRRLCNFGHVVVRAGVSGAFYCKSQFSERGELLNRKTWLVYDANAKGGIFRDLVSQGNVFGTRSAFAACIADSLYKGENSRTNKSADSFSNSSQYVLEGIRKAITTSQFLYQEGFGDTIAKVRAYPNHLRGRLLKYLTQPKHQFLHQLEYDNSIAHTDWGIVYHSLLCKDQTKDFKKPLNRIDCRRLVEIRRLRAAIQIVLSGVDETINKYQPTDWMATSFESHLTIEECLLKLTWSERIDVETHIAHYFSDILMEWNTLFPVDNETWENFGLGPRERNTFKELVLRWKQAEEQWVRLRLELSSDRVNAETFEATILGILDQGSITPLPLPEDKGFFARAGDEFKQVVSQLESNEGSLCKAFLEDIRDKIRSLVSESRRLSVPFNFPMATFGMMRVIGRKDVEAFNDIRNRVLFHIQSGATQPLSLAVFGPPGSGKSFGVTQIARDYGASMFEEINCNLSQGSDTSILDKTFVRVADAIATGKTPLVFFDEFDCGISGGETLSWLKYFLQPMQDGYYQHPDGRISAGNSKFIFAGGTHESYETFQEKIAKGEGKQEKLPDFVSRLKGFVNIPNVSPRQPTNRYVDKGPYVGNDSEEIPYLRRAMLIRSIINRKKMVRPFRNQLAGVGDVGIGLMDIDLLRAFLMVSRYRHGSRSITALLDIASPFYHAITKASMPSPEQLDMHTDALDFGLLLQDPIKDGKLSQVVTDKLLGGMAGANDSYVPMVSQFTTEITVYGANEVALRWDHGG